MNAPENPLKHAQTRRLVHIGIICAQWSSLEHALAQVIWILLGTGQETGKIVTGGLDMLPRVNMAINLARHLKAPQPLIERLVKTRAEIQDDLAEQRNRAVHGVQFFDGPDAEMFVEVHRGKGGRERKPLTEANLNRVGERLHLLDSELRAETLRHGDALRRALLSMAENIRETVSRELGPGPSG